MTIELAAGGRHVLLPMNFARVRRNEVRVGALLGGQFVNVPGTRQADVVAVFKRHGRREHAHRKETAAEAGRAEPLL